MLSSKGFFLTFIIYLCTLQYKSAILNQLKIHDFYFLINFQTYHFYVICTIIQNE